MDCLDSILCKDDCLIDVLNTDGTVADVDLLEDGDQILIRYHDRPGYMFVRWEDENGQDLGLTLSGLDNYTYIASARCGGTFNAVFEKIPYTITLTVSPVGYGSVTGDGTYYYGDVATITAAESNGYRFTGWYSGGYLVTEDFTYEFQVYDNNSFEARFVKREYTITASANDGYLGSVTGGGVYSYGDTCTLTATAVSGSTFTQWSDGEVSATRTVTVEGNAAYVAEFMANSYTVTVSKNVSACVVTGGGTYDYNTTIMLHARPSDGYYFSGWTVDGGSDVVSKSPDLTVSVTGNKVYTANFSVLVYRLHAVVRPYGTGSITVDGSTITEDYATFPYNTSVTLMASPYSGYAFSRWSDGTTSRTITLVMNRNIEITAYFSQT